MNKKAIRMFYHLCGLIEEKKGNLDKALAYYSDALELAPYEHYCETYLRLDRAPYLESMGNVYFKMGELDVAIEQFEKIQGLTLGRVDYGDIYAKSYFNLGKIFEQKSWEGKAIEQYEKFLALWKDADPGIAEVEDARKRLGGLKD
jgi:tetratricopeptide (TPR) repeat protein